MSTIDGVDVATVTPNAAVNQIDAALVRPRTWAGSPRLRERGS